MKPQKKTIFVKKEIWTCRKQHHRHISEDTAWSCLSRISENPAPPKSELIARGIHAAKLALNGTTFKAVGEELGIGDSGARVLVLRHIRRSLHKRYGDTDDEMRSIYLNIKSMRKHKDYFIERLDRRLKTAIAEEKTS